MNNIIQFPPRGKDALSHALEVIRGHYATAGFSQAASDAAIGEVKPLLSKYLGSKIEFVMDIPACGLTPVQIDLITEAHNKCVQNVLRYHYEQIGIAICEIAGLVGSKHVADE